MTEQEAIYCLKAVSERYPQVCEECQLYGQTGCDHCYDDANDMAIKALEMISKRDELEDFNTLENYIAEWNKYKVFHSDNPTEELYWIHALIHYYMVQYKLYKDSELSPKEVLEMKTAYEQYKALGTVEELRVARDKQIPKKVIPRHIRKYDGFDDGE